MTESDASLARRAGVTVPVLKAIRAVESGGSASAIRFEPHVFLRDRPDLAGRIPYTPHETRAPISLVPSETNRAAFDRAFALDPRVAVTSTSWGTYQALGGKLLPLFGNDPARAVRGFYADPVQVSNDILVRWMDENPRAVEAANRQDWFNFVKRYNGCCSGSESTEENCRRCDRYLARFAVAYNAALAGGGGALALLALAGGAWWAWRRRR